MKAPAFSNLRRAVAEYDRTEPERATLWENAQGNEDVLAAERADGAALDLVREAFYLDTSDRNSRAACHCIGISYARACLARQDARATLLRLLWVREMRLLFPNSFIAPELLATARVTSAGARPPSRLYKKAPKVRR